MYRNSLIFKRPALGIYICVLEIMLIDRGCSGDGLSVRVFHIKKCYIPFPNTGLTVSYSVQIVRYSVCMYVYIGYTLYFSRNATPHVCCVEGCIMEFSKC